MNLGGKRYQFKNDPSTRTKIISELKPIFQKSLKKNKLSDDGVDEKIGDFLDKLVFAVKQPSGASLEQRIKDTIGNEFNLINEIIYNDFFKFMHDWMKYRIKDSGEKGGGRAYFLTDEDIKLFLSQAKEKIASLGLISSTLLCKREIEKFGLEFKDNIEAVKEIREFLSKQGSKERILIVCSKSGLLSKIKVFQMLASHDANRSIFLDLKSLSLLVGSSVDPVSAFSSKERNYLIIENLSTPDKDAKDLLSSFYQIVIKELNKKFILIIQPEQKDNIQKLFEDENYVKIIEDDDNKLKDLTSKSKEKILETEITLFGEKRKLTSLTTDASKDDLYSAIDGDALTTLINGDSNVIGSEDKYDFDTYIDIPRTLTYQTKIDKKCLEENKNDLFAISGIEKSDFSQLVPKKEKRREFVDKDSNEKGPIRFIRLDNHHDIKKDFDELCRDYKKRTIHLLENKDSVLEWKQSHGSLFNLRRFILETGSQTKKIKDLTDSAIIAGEAGMGKSTILTTYSMSKDSLWPIRINLKDYQTDIDNANFDDLSGIVEFLSNIIDPASSKTSLIKNLLQYCLTQQGQVTLLLDGYDEIKDRSQEKVVQLLRTLRTTKGKVLITTRSYVRSELENALGIFAYSLDAFDKKQQKEFLKNFWIKTLNVKEPTQEKKIDKFTKQLLNYFHELNLMKKEGLVGIVLQARMVAEVFQDKCKEYLQHKKFNSHDFGISNISDLYEKFVECQYERYLKEKIEISTKLSEGSRTLLTRSYTKAYGDLALKLLFSEDQIKGLLSKKIFLREELQDIGLVKILKNDGTADFLHLTYAEYFVADFLVNALRKEKDHSKYRAVDNFLRMQIFRDHNKVIHDFIENKIKKESDSNLSSKWKAIQNCNLLKGVKTKVELQLSRPPDDALSGKSLTELLEEFKENTPKGIYKSREGYFYNYKDKDKKTDTSLIDRVFDNFTKETNIKELKGALNYFMEIKNGGGIHLRFVDSTLKRRLDGAIGYFLNECKKQDKLEHQYLAKILQVKLPVFDEIKENFSRISGTHNADQYKNLLESLYSILEKKINLGDLPYLSLALEFYYKDFMDRIKLYIDSDESIQKKYTEKTINFLKGLSVGNCGLIDSALGDMTTCGFLQSFFTHIVHHANIIEYTKSSINEIYKDKDLTWLEREGVLISRVLEILTPEMSERFNSVLDGTINGFTRIYSGGVFVDLIDYIVNRVRVEKLPQIDRLAFLKMLVRFVGFSVEADRELPFTSEQLKTTLKLITDILSEQRQITIAVSESIDYLFILGKSGLKLIDAEKELLVLDPAGKFEYTLSSDYINQIIELIKWKSENPFEPQEKFLRECYETIELKKGNLKRKGSESDLQELKRLKVENCLLNRRKREAENECLFTWEDIDEFNEEKDEKRNFGKIKIDSEKFIDYIKDLPKEKQSQIIQLASGVKITGESQSLVNKLISNQKVVDHLGRVGRVSGMVMHGMMAKNVVADFLNGDYQGVAINLGFIAGGQGFARVAQAASVKGAGLVSDGKLFLGRSLKAASPFLARGTSAFVAYDLVNQIKEYKKGNKDALVGIVGDSIYLGVDSAEIGIEIAEAFAVFEGVSSVTGPIGAAIGAVVFVGTDVYLAVKKVDKIDEIIHLTGWEKFKEGWRGFLGIQPEQYIKELMEEKQVNNQLVTQALEYLKQHSDIQRYVFPTGRSVTNSDRLQIDLDNKVLLDRKRTDIKWSRARQSDSGAGKFLCLPQGNYASVPRSGAYLCKNAIGVEYTNNRTGGDTLISLGSGNDDMVGFPQGNHIVVLGEGHKNVTLGNGDDTLLLEGNNIKGAIYGGNGTNTLDLEHFAQKEKSVQVGLSRAFGYVYYEKGDEISDILGIHGINDVLLRRDKQDTVYTACDTRYVDGRGGEDNNNTDNIIIPHDSNCSYEIKLVVRPYTNIKNYAINGNFTYIVPVTNRGEASISLTTHTDPQSNHRFVFSYTLYDINNIKKINNTVSFSFIQNVGNLRFAPKPINTDDTRYTTDYEFSITNNAANNALYKLSDNTEVKVGERNIYSIQSTEKPVDEIVNDYPTIANNLKMSIFVQSLLNNETVAIGHGNHDVLHNDPYYKSHLVGNGGENIFIITSGYEVMDESKLPIPEVVIYDLDKENLIDTLDLRQIKQQIVKDLGKEVKAKTFISNTDIIIELLCAEENQIIVQLRLKDALITNWHERLHVVIDNIPMKIEEFELKPLPLVFSESDKNIIVIGPQDIEEGNKIIVSKEIGNYTFARSGNNLMITNAFDRNLTDNKLCTISLKGFYQEAEMQTLDIKFNDKEMILTDHQEEISAARDIDVVKKEHKDQVYNDVFNHTKSSPEVIMLSDQPVTHRHRHSRHREQARHRRSTKSSSTRPTGWINDLFGWVKSSVSGLLSSKPESTPSSISQVDARVDVNGTIMLFDILIRKVTGQKYVSTADQSISQLEAQGYALNITKGFEKVVEQAGLKSGVSMHRLNIDYMGMQKEIVRKVIRGQFNEISGVLSSYLEKACPSREAGCPDKLSSKKFDKFMVEFNSGLLNQSIEHNGDGRLEVDGVKEQKTNSGPQSYLSNASVQGHLTRNKVKLIS